MATQSSAFTVFPITGGLDLTSNPATLAPGWFTWVENAEYVTGRTGDVITLSLKKRGGTNKYNATAITGTPAITALADFWRHGASLSPTQKFVACAGDAIWKDDGDGVWDNILASGFGSSTAQSNIVIAQGLAIFSNNNNDAPRKWDQTTLAALAGSPPNFTAGVYHLRRLFAIGIPATPSQCTFSAAGNVETWSGSDSSNFVFDEDDGDRLVGLSQPFHGRLYFFKGPNFGAVHEITGTTPTTFARNKVVTGLPCVGHKGIVTTSQDVYWLSRFGIHSLATTAKYGDVEELYLSYPIQKEFNRTNFARIEQVQSFSNPTRNIIGWFVPTGSNTQNDTCFVYNTAAKRWATWRFSSFRGASCMVAQTPTTQLPRLYIGGYAGFAFSGDQTTLADFDATVGYSFRVRSPYHINLGEGAGPLVEKQFESLTTFTRPTGSYNADINLSVDGRTQATTIALQAQGDLIGTTFTMNTSTIGTEADTKYIEAPIEDRGRGIQIEWRQSGVNEDMEISGYALRHKPAESFALENS